CRSRRSRPVRGRASQCPDCTSTTPRWSRWPARCAPRRAGSTRSPTSTSTTSNRAACTSRCSPVEPRGSTPGASTPSPMPARTCARSSSARASRSVSPKRSPGARASSTTTPSPRGHERSASRGMGLTCWGCSRRSRTESAQRELEASRQAGALRGRGRRADRAFLDGATQQHLVASLTIRKRLHQLEELTAVERLEHTMPEVPLLRLLRRPPACAVLPIEHVVVVPPGKVLVGELRIVDELFELLHVLRPLGHSLVLVQGRQSARSGHGLRPDAVEDRADLTVLRLQVIEVPRKVFVQRASATLVRAVRLPGRAEDAVEHAARLSGTRTKDAMRHSPCHRLSVRGEQILDVRLVRLGRPEERERERRLVEVREDTRERGATVEARGQRYPGGAERSEMPADRTEQVAEVGVDGVDVRAWLDLVEGVEPL